MNVNEILDQRGATHGDYELQSFYAQNLKMPVQQHRAKQMQRQQQQGVQSSSDMSYGQYEALEMIAHKMGRILAGNPNFQDHWDDIAGYATLVSRQIAKKEAQAQEAINARNIKGAPQVEEVNPTNIAQAPRFLSTETAAKESVQ